MNLPTSGEAASVAPALQCALIVTLPLVACEFGLMISEPEPEVVLLPVQFAEADWLFGDAAQPEAGGTTRGRCPGRQRSP